MLLSGWQQALTVLLTVIPGFVYQGARSHFRGPTPDEREIGVRILRALALSGIFGLTYVALFGASLTGRIFDPSRYLGTPRGWAGAALLLLFVVPFLMAALVHTWSAWRKFPDLTVGQFFRIYSPTPTAWDFASTGIEPGFVRVLTKDGLWIGGYAAESSFFTSYPEPRELYLEVAWRLNNDGAFEQPVPNSKGMWVRCDDAQVVQFISIATPTPPPPPPAAPATGTNP